jgi:two-component system, NarL family, sensor histidine kinase DegS
MTYATDFWRRFWERLHDRRFWIVQVLVLAIATVHTTIEAMGELQNTQDLYLVPIYFVPVLYAALNFGVEGALPTGLWCLLLTLPNIVMVHHGAEGIGVLAQLVFLVLLGSMVAIRIDTERSAKLAAEDANRRLAEVQASLKSFIGLALRAQEDERFRLSRELHDETVQELVVAKAALENVPGGEGQHARLELVDAALQRCIDGIRRFCRALRPSVLDDLGLVPALEWLLEEHGDRLRLDPEQELVIFRVAQEALHNIEHHAHASRVVVRLAYDPGPLCLEVVDDGCGFDPAQDRQGRLGLAGMQERASLIGAVFEVLSRPGETSVRLDLPPVSNPAVVDLVPDATDLPYDWTAGFRRP